VICRRDAITGPLAGHAEQLLLELGPVGFHGMSLLPGEFGVPLFRVLLTGVGVDVQPLVLVLVGVLAKPF
jgi:hypothetical protein